MPWCPNCRKDYTDRVNVCPGCGGELLPAIPDEEDLLTDVEWVTVAENVGPVVASLIKQRLEAEGIPAILQGGVVDTVQQYPGCDERIQVPRRCFAEADAIVRAMMEEREDELVCSECGRPIDYEDKICPHCGEEFVPEEELEIEEGADG